MHTSQCPTENKLTTTAVSSQPGQNGGGSALLLTVPEVQAHRQLHPLAVAGLMPLARHVAAGHQPRRLRTAGSTQRQR